MRNSLYFSFILSVILVLTVTTLAWAADIEVPEGDPLQSLLALILNWKSLTAPAIGSAIISIVVQSFRKFLPSSALKKGAVVLLGVVYAVIQSMMSGMGVLDALVLVLLTSGGAVAIYEWVIKPFFPAPAPVVNPVQPLPTNILKKK